MSDTISFIQFEKISDIGNDEGKNSYVFLARDKQLDEQLVIKQMNKEKFNPDEYFSEAKMIYANKHPNIVEIQYASQDKDNIYLAMPYYKNGSLNNLAKSRFLSVREIIRYSLDILSALNYIHSRGLLHLDIKPTNILIDDSGKALLTDFGLSKFMDENGIAKQPYNYRFHADPEWYKHEGRTVQSDIYQIGLTMYRLCNGVDILNNQYCNMSITTLKDLEQKVISGIFPDRKYFLPHIPTKLQKVILKSLQVNPRKRYNNVIAMMNDLGTIDNNLDWIFTGDNGKPYIKQDETYLYEICVMNNDIICSRTKNDSGRKTKIQKHCYENLGEEDINIKLSSIIKTLN